MQAEQTTAIPLDAASLNWSPCDSDSMPEMRMASGFLAMACAMALRWFSRVCS